MADRPLILRRLLASHRDHRANLLGGVCRRRARARRMGEPLRHRLRGRRLPPPPAPIPHRLRPHVEFSRALADANIVGGIRRHAKSYEPATPTVVRSNGLAPALPALHGAQAKQSPDRRPPGHRNFPSQLPIRHATAPPIRLLFCCRKAASLILPSYLHARRSRYFRSAVLVASSWT